MVSGTNLRSPIEAGIELVVKTSGCCYELEAYLVLGLFGAFERKAMAMLVEER